MAMNNAATRLSALESLLDLTWNDREILLEALLTPGCGVPRAGSRRVTDGNKPLAMLGDAVMRQIIVEDHYLQGHIRGEIDLNVQRVVANANLRAKGEAFGLQPYIVLNPSQHGVVNPRVLQDTVEAIVGAAFLDGGATAARHVMGAFNLVW